MRKIVITFTDSSDNWPSAPPLKAGRPASPTRTERYSGEESFIHIFVSGCARIASPTLLYYCRHKKILKMDGAREVNASIDFGYKNKFTLQKWIEQLVTKFGGQLLRSFYTKLVEKNCTPSHFSCRERRRCWRQILKSIRAFIKYLASK